MTFQTRSRELAEKRRKFLALVERRKKETPLARLYMVVGGNLDGTDYCWQHRSRPTDGYIFGWAYHHAQWLEHYAFDEPAGVFRFRSWDRVNRG